MAVGQVILAVDAVVALRKLPDKSLEAFHRSLVVADADLGKGLGKSQISAFSRVGIALESLGEDPDGLLVLLLLQQRVANDGIGPLLAVIAGLIVVLELHIEELARKILGPGEVLLVVVELGQQHAKSGLLLGIFAGGDQLLVVARRLLFPLQTDHARPQSPEGAVLDLGCWIAVQQRFHIDQRGFVHAPGAGRIAGRVLLLGHLVVGPATGQKRTFEDLGQRRLLERHSPFADRPLEILLGEVDPSRRIVHLALQLFLVHLAQSLSQRLLRPFVLLLADIELRQFDLHLGPLLPALLHRFVHLDGLVQFFQPLVGEAQLHVRGVLQIRVGIELQERPVHGLGFFVSGCRVLDSGQLQQTVGGGMVLREFIHQPLVGRPGLLVLLFELARKTHVEEHIRDQTAVFVLVQQLPIDSQSIVDRLVCAGRILPAHLPPLLLIALGHAEENLLLAESHPGRNILIGAEIDLVLLGSLEILLLVVEHQRHSQLGARLEEPVLDLLDGVLVRGDGRCRTLLFLDELGRADIGVLHQHRFGRILDGKDRVRGHGLFDLPLRGVDIPLFQMGLGHQLARGLFDYALELERGHLDDLLLGHLREIVAVVQTVEIVQGFVVLPQAMVALGDLKERAVRVRTPGSQNQHLLEALDRLLILLQFKVGPGYVVIGGRLVQAVGEFLQQRLPLLDDLLVVFQLIARLNHLVLRHHPGALFDLLVDRQLAKMPQAGVQIHQGLLVARLGLGLVTLGAQELGALQLFEPQLVVGIAQLIGGPHPHRQDEFVDRHHHLFHVDHGVALGGENDLVALDGLVVIPQSVELLAFLKAILQLHRREKARAQTRHGAQRRDHQQVYQNHHLSISLSAPAGPRIRPRYRRRGANY